MYLGHGHLKCVCSTQTDNYQKLEEKSLKFWDMYLLALLLRVRWEDRYALSFLSSSLKTGNREIAVFQNVTESANWHLKISLMLCGLFNSSLNLKPPNIIISYRLIIIIR